MLPSPSPLSSFFSLGFTGLRNELRETIHIYLSNEFTWYVIINQFNMQKKGEVKKNRTTVDTLNCIQGTNFYSTENTQEARQGFYKSVNKWPVQWLREFLFNTT